jgi:hypothetical protein
LKEEVADVALALPARFAGWVAAVHAVVQVLAALVTASAVSALSTPLAGGE